MFKLIIVTMGLLGPVPETQAQVFLNREECQQAFLLWEAINDMPPHIYVSHKCVRSL